jgi:hypothetical protein
MIRKGIRSTTKPTINEIMTEELETEPQLEPPRHITNRQHHVVVEIIAFKDLKGIIAIDLPGQFPTTSGHGISYVLVMARSELNHGLISIHITRTDRRSVVTRIFYTIKLV